MGVDQTYQAQLALPGFDDKTQKMLKHSHVAIVGIGGLGCPAAMCLAGAGVGKITLIDGDSIKQGNLHRQFLYDFGDVGKSKVTVATEVLQRKFNRTEFHGINAMTDRENIDNHLNGCQVVLDCTDNPLSRYNIDDYCEQKGMPLVYAGVHQFEGQLSVFHFEKGYSYRSVFPEGSDLHSVSCSQTGVLNTLTQLFGSLQANEALKILTGIGEVTSGKMHVMNVLNNNSYEFILAKSSRTGGLNEEKQDRLNSPSLISMEELLANRGQYYLIDLSDEWEPLKEEGVIPDVRLTPNDLKQHLERVDKHKRLVFMCERGLKSRAAAMAIGKGRLFSAVLVLERNSIPVKSSTKKTETL